MADVLKTGAMSELATKLDIQDVRCELRDMENRLVIKLGAMIAGAFALLFAAQKLIH